MCICSQCTVCLPFSHNLVVYFCCDCTRTQNSPMLVVVYSRQWRVLQHSNARENERAFNGVYVNLKYREPRRERFVGDGMGWLASNVDWLFVGTHAGCLQDARYIPAVMADSRWRAVAGASGWPFVGGRVQAKDVVGGGVGGGVDWLWLWVTAYATRVGRWWLVVAVAVAIVIVIVFVALMLIL